MEKTIVGYISKIKTDKPYPFARPNGDVWLGKIRIKYVDYEEDGELEEETYKAYPLEGTGLDWTLKLPIGTKVSAVVEHKPKSPYRGILINLTVLVELP